MPRVFGMVSLASSLEYTKAALESFFSYTPLGTEDRFILIDNDGSAAGENFEDIYTRLTYFSPEKPRSFAENGNFIIAAADAIGADAYFMNNDVIFSHCWLAPMDAQLQGTLSPTSNQNISLKKDGFELKPVMTLSEYKGHEATYLKVCEEYSKADAPVTLAYKTNFFLVKIPPIVYRTIGGFDTRFSPGGGEDDDYSVRAHLAGFGVFVTPRSVVLHFGGRSSWGGPESKDEWFRREANFVEVFQQKWGTPLARFLLRRDRTILDSRADWLKIESEQGIGALMRAMAKDGGVEITQDKIFIPFSASHSNSGARDLYLDLMKKCLANTIYGDSSIVNIAYGDMTHMQQHSRPYDSTLRNEGRDWPAEGHTMIGLKRLNNIQFCAESAIQNQIPGDFIETGVWRGGATIFLRAILKAYEITDRSVWVCDSFEGVPPPNAEKYPADTGLFYNQMKGLAVSVEEVKENFRRYDLLDSQVRFAKGWFRDSLPSLPIEKISVLRLDGDLYESTMDALTHLYPKLSPGGYCIIDDYLDIKACREAVDNYRRDHHIHSKIIPVDWTAVYWQKEV